MMQMLQSAEPLAHPPLRNALVIARLKQFTKQMFPFAVPVASAVRHQFSKRKIQRLLRERSEISVEVGAGDKRGQGEWITVDLGRNCDIRWDLRRGLPFPDRTLQKIYSSHFFEHLSFSEAQTFLEECQRALIPGGKFLICVPNARIYIEAYVSGRSLDEGTYFQFAPAYNHTTRMDYVNYMAYMGGHHKYMFDEENLLHILRAKGFRNCRLRPFDPALDRRERDFESFYAEAEK